MESHFSAAEIEKKKKENAKRFSKKELDGYRRMLLDIRNKIAGDLQSLEREGLNNSQRDASGDLSGYSFHMADQATDNFDREFNLGLASNEQQILNLVDTALRRIEDGTYGLCEMTLKPISKKRLQAMPYARLCLEAQENEEKERRRL